ncbi:uncharacterized protein RAG0_10935 [Rhynchosporium agropyri]|uniref:Chitin-binding type-1 domain-containing protein n=1 Tax=Rhynchosporium agropyri TaxID=914238 RepID=A0A1E1L1Z9_9HELO|nr:uncharacterized protein RAG0_10935 [Rhynchosporium agropyri]
MQFSQIIVLLSLVSLVFSHMEVSIPAPFRSKSNPNSNKNTIDYSMTSPLQTSGGKLCKGYQTDFADASGVGKTTATYAQGSENSVTIIGGAAHDGGSCQISLSPDGNSNFVVIKTVMGKCVGPDGFQIPFTIPGDAPLGRQILAWSWIPHSSGVPEFYHNCAAVEVTASSGAKSTVAFSSRPAMFVANIGNGCTTKGSTDPRYPNPGPDSIGTGDEGSVIGTCGGPSTGPSPPAGKSPELPPSSVVIIPVSSPTVGSSVSSTSKFSFASTTVAPALPTLVTVTRSSSLSATPSSVAPIASGVSTPTSSSSIPLSTGALEVSTDGTCKTKKCPGTTCCSSASYCGSSPLHCGTGCQSAFGTCTGGNTTVKARGLSGRIQWN